MQISTGDYSMKYTAWLPRKWPTHSAIDSHQCQYCLSSLYIDAAIWYIQAWTKCLTFCNWYFKCFSLAQKKTIFWLKINWNMYLGIQLIISRHWSRYDAGTEEMTSDYQGQIWCVCWCWYIKSSPGQSITCTLLCNWNDFFKIENKT